MIDVDDVIVPWTGQEREGIAGENAIRSVSALCHAWGSIARIYSEAIDHARSQALNSQIFRLESRPEKFLDPRYGSLSDLPCGRDILFHMFLLKLLGWEWKRGCAEWRRS
jgi:hypothetical protein